MDRARGGVEIRGDVPARIIERGIVVCPTISPHWKGQHEHWDSVTRPARLRPATARISSWWRATLLRASTLRSPRAVFAAGRPYQPTAA